QSEAATQQAPAAGRRAEPGQPAVGLRLPHPLPLRDRALQERDARAPGHRPRAPGVVSFAVRKRHRDCAPRAPCGSQSKKIFSTTPSASCRKLAEASSEEKVLPVAAG